jgi:hypothetical protein
VEALIFVALMLSAGASFAGSFSVAAIPAPYQLFSGDIQSICGPSNLGCTDITTPTLRATCAKRDDSWRVEAAVRFGVVVHLPALAGPAAKHKLLVHEYAHIKDIHREAETYARELSGRRFASLDDCRALTLQEESAFRGRVAQFAKQSVAARR